MSDFISFARAHGLDLSHVSDFDRMLRCPTFHRPRKRNGAYLLRRDGNGWVIAFDGDGELRWFNDPHSVRTWTAEEKAAWQRKQDAQRRARVEGWAKAARKACEQLSTCHAGPNGYLHRKGFPELPALCLPDGALFVPMRHLDSNELVGAQIVRWLPDERRFEKKFTTGMRAKGAVLRLGRRGDATILCEGYATGLSIHAAARFLNLSASVLVCFSDSNMVHIATQLANAPYRRFIFADNDESQAGERAAVATGLPYVMSPVCPGDANDLHQSAGLLTLASLVIRLVRSREKPSATPTYGISAPGADARNAP